MLGRAFPGGPLAGLVFGFIVSAAAGLPEGLVAGAVGGFVFGFGLMLIEGGTDESSPLGPRDIWRNDQKVGLVFGLVFGLLVGLGTGFASGLAVGFAVGLAVAVAGVLVYPETWPTTLAWRQLQLSGQVPVIRLMPFLEDARERGVLRTVGAVYQFRHATLQEQLARQAVSDSAEPSAVPRVS